MQIDVIKTWYAIYDFLPAYFANATPAVLGGGRPIDFGHNFIDGHRIFGDHKTIRGFISGLIIGVPIGFLQNALLLSFLLSLGALLGDLAGAFIKRRVNLQPGAPSPILDQLDFVAGAFLLSAIHSPPRLEAVFSVVLLTPLIHVITNILAYLLKLKDRPL